MLCLGDKLDGVNSCTQQLYANKFKAKSNQLLSMNPLRAEISCRTTQPLPCRKPGLLGQKWKNSVTRWLKWGLQVKCVPSTKRCYSDDLSHWYTSSGANQIDFRNILFKKDINISTAELLWCIHIFGFPLALYELPFNLSSYLKI